MIVEKYSRLAWEEYIFCNLTILNSFLVCLKWLLLQIHFLSNMLMLIFLGLRPPHMLLPPAQLSKPNPNVLSAPPSIMRLGQKSVIGQSDEGPAQSHSKQEGATISAKPQIKHVIGDVTRFMPTALKVKRTVKDSRGRVIKTNTGMA